MGVPVQKVLPVCCKSDPHVSTKKHTVCRIFFFHTVCQYIFFSFCTGIGKCWYASTKKSILYWHEDRDFYDVADISAHAAIVPADPARLLAPDNAVVVGMAARTALLRVCKTGGHAQYVKALGEMASSRRPTVW